MDWKEAFDEARVNYGVVQMASEVIRDPRIHASRAFLPVDDPEVRARRTRRQPTEAPMVSPPRSAT
ncbi:hypothetical protein B0G73_1137 [Paraburkholderia sp. BL25I1N1]|nr:hypothetical protein B0G73_1137 [Paraburkholderia sp. BL25I1N1]